MFNPAIYRSPHPWVTGCYTQSLPIRSICWCAGKYTIPEMNGNAFYWIKQLIRNALPHGQNKAADFAWYNNE